MLKLHLLGTLKLTDAAGAPLPVPVVQDRRLALLGYLAMAGAAGPIRREKLLCLFWPEKSEERARNLLSQSLCHLRKALGEGAVCTPGSGEVWLDPRYVRCDATEFEEDLLRGRREEALARYHGPFLDGFVPRDVPDFIEWEEAERHRLAELALEGALGLSTSAARSAEGMETAVAWARWAFRQAPLDEAVLRHLLRTLTRCGRSAEAVDEYRRFRARLRVQLELEPDPKTRKLVRRIRRRNAGPVHAA